MALLKIRMAEVIKGWEWTHQDVLCIFYRALSTFIELEYGIFVQVVYACSYIEPVVRGAIQNYRLFI